ncbi:hypothetical protein V9657_002578 [Vibrio vulnificus]|nr:hypothetical protein [Vibrio vulnificus]HAS8458923.1 hypothetical protein [Vibrio vulnificus]
MSQTNSKYTFKRAIIGSFVLSALITLLLFLFKGFYTIDIKALLKLITALITSLFIGLLIKDFYELRKKISDFKLDDSSPEKIKISLRRTIDVFFDNYTSKNTIIMFSATYLISLVLCFSILKVENETLLFVFSHFTFCFFIFYTFFMASFIFELNSVMRKFDSWLESQKSREEKRKELIEKINKIRTEYQSKSGIKNKSKNKQVDIRELIQSKKDHEES